MIAAGESSKIEGIKIFCIKYQDYAGGVEIFRIKYQDYVGGVEIFRSKYQDYAASVIITNYLNTNNLATHYKKS